jgi:hypothetical protein
MGMDLYGIKPNSNDGEYFGNNVWWWRPLWYYVEYYCGEILTPQQIKGGHHNVGQIVFDWQAELLGNRLLQLIKEGSTKAVEIEQNTKYQNFPVRRCIRCLATGEINKDQNRHIAFENNTNSTSCPECNGKGEIRDIPDEWFPFAEENVRNFAIFCKQSGGFSIW